MVVITTKVITEETARKMLRTLIDEDLTPGGSYHKTHEIYQWGDKLYDHSMYTVELSINPEDMDKVIARSKELNDDKKPAISILGVMGDSLQEALANSRGNINPNEERFND